MKAYHHKSRNCLMALFLTLSLPLQADLLQSSTITAINTELNNTSWAASNLHDDNSSTRWLSTNRNYINDINFQFSASGDAFCFDTVDLINYGNDDRSVQQFMLLSSSNVGISGDTSTNAIGWKPVVADDAPSGLLNYLSWAQGGRLASIDSQLNTTTWAAKNSHDGSAFSRWLSKSTQSYNILEYNFDTDWDGSTGNGIPIEEIEITNYGNDDRSIKELQIEVTTNGINWFKLEVPGTAANDLEYVYTQSQEGGVLGAVNSQLNTSTWAAANIHDGSQLTRWLSKNTQGNNTIEFTFDPNNNGLTGANGDGDDLFNIDKLYLENYGADDRSIKEFQVAVKTLLNPNWSKITVPGATIGTAGYDFLRSHHGAELLTIDSQLNSTTWGADNLHDGDHMTRWLSKNRQSNNTFEFQFDVNEDGTKNATDHFTINSLFLQNYGNDDRSIREFQVSVKTASNSSWQKIKVPGAMIGAANYNFLLKDQGGILEAVDSQLNTTSWGAKNIHDGSQITRWLSINLQSKNKLEFRFDVDEDGTTGTASDLFIMESFYLENYGIDDRSIREFQVSVKTLSEPTWQKIKVPDSTIGTADHNFLLEDHGGILTAIDSQLNATSWAAKNIHDGSQITRWLSLNTQLSNTLEFQFDVDEDGTTGTASDLFIMESFYLENYGVDDRSIREFQVAVKTQSEPTWKKIKVPGSTIGTADHNFLLTDHGGILTAVDSQLNTSSWAAQNIHDGNQITRWLSLNTQLSNTLDFQFDVNEDGTTGTTADLFSMESFYLQNYGNDDRSIKEFQIEVKTSSNISWAKVQVPGTAANDANFNFSLALHGGELTSIDSELNTSSWAAKNIHDGNPITRWLSRNTQFINTLEFAFDTDNNGSTGDIINLDTIELINYGNDDRSIQTFEIDIQISGGAWQAVNEPGGGTIFTANMDRNGQSWSVTPQTNVTATRIRTLSNYGDPNYIGASEIIFSGASVGPSYTFTAAMHGNGETFSLLAPIAEVTDVRLRTISNHGDPNYVGAAEFKVLGPSTIESSTFVAAMHRNGETFTLTTPLVDVTDVKLMTISNHGDPNYVGATEFKVLGPSIIESSTFVAAMHSDGETFTLTTPLVDVTDVQLITISNHGDPNYVGAAEFKVLGPSITETATFIAAMHGNGETFELDNDDIPVDVTDVKLTTISNHGDPNYVGAKDFKVLGDSITETKTFIAAMHGNGETFELNNDDIPVGVTDVKLITINNHGDPNYVGAAEFEVIGRSVTAAHTFILPMQAEPYRIALDNDDTVTGVIGARIVTIRNHGDPNYTGAADFQLLGTAIGPSYVFEAAMDSSTQNFTFSPLTSSLLRFHTLNNYGDPNYTGVSELVLNSTFCPTGQWKLDEKNWNGTIGEVIDSSGGGHEGTVFGIGSGLSDPNTANTTPAILGNPGTCRYGEFDGVDDFIEIPDSEDLDNTAQITLSAWFNAKSFTQTNGTNARGLFSKRPSFSNNVSYGAFFLNGQASNLYIDIDGFNDRFTSNTTFNLNTWYHIAIVFDGTQLASQRVRLYVDGALDGTFTETSSSIPDTTSNFYIGNLYTGVNQLKVFDGSIDEVNVIPKALSAAEVLKLKNATQPCAVTPVFLDISTTGNNGSTCAAKQFTIRACLDAACSTLFPNYDGNIGINVSSGHGDWSINSANGTLTDAISDDGVASYTFDAALDESSVILDLNNSHAETITITVNDVDASAIAISDNIQFSDNAFVIDHTDNLHVAGRDQPMSASLYTKNGDECAINPLYTGSKDLHIWLDRDVADPSGLAPKINSVALPNVSSTPFNLTFANGTADFNLASTDVGKYDFNIVDDSLSFSDKNIVGVTNIVTRPFGFDVSVSGDEGEINAKAADASDGKFMAAGDDFIVNVRAVVWEAADDINNDGIPDGHDDFNPSNNADLSNNPVVKSFGQAESVATIAYEFLPIKNTATNVLEDGSLLCINCNISGSSFTSGIGDTGKVYYNEVGIIEVTATLTDNSYLGGANVIGASGFVGRFVPHHFNLKEISAGELSGGNGFVYTGQINADLTGAISYGPFLLDKPQFTITAVSSSGKITKKYTGKFMKLDPTDDFMKLKEFGIDRTIPEFDSTKATSAIQAKLLPPVFEENEGVITYTFNAKDHFLYTRNAAAMVDKFPATIDLVIDSVTDDDGITTVDDLNGPTNDGVLTMTPNRPPAELDIYFGRWNIANTYGPETSPLFVRMEIQYWNGSNFITNTDEDTQTVDAAALDVTDIDLSPGITNPTGNGTFASGVSRDITLSAPGEGNHGNVEIDYDVPSWLLYEWKKDEGLSKPTATATFGIFRGNDRIIYWREVFQ